MRRVSRSRARTDLAVGAWSSQPSDNVASPLEGTEHESRSTKSLQRDVQAFESSLAIEQAIVLRARLVRTRLLDSLLRISKNSVLPDGANRACHARCDYRLPH